MAIFRNVTVPLLFLDRITANGRTETAFLSMVTVGDWPGIVSSARVVFRQNGVTTVYPDDFSEFLVEDRITPTSQKAIAAQHALAFTASAIKTLQDKVQEFYAERPTAMALSA